MKILRKIRDAICYAKAAAHNDAGRFEMALVALSKVSDDGDIGAKKSLFSADILHRKGDFLKSHRQYLVFLENHIGQVSEENDKKYLSRYARYFSKHAAHKAGIEIPDEISLGDVRHSSAEATKLCKAEFTVP